MCVIYDKLKVLLEIRCLDNILMIDVKMIWDILSQIFTIQ